MIHDSCHSCEEDQPDSEIDNGKEEASGDEEPKASCIVAQRVWCDVCAESLCRISCITWSLHNMSSKVKRFKSQLVWHCTEIWIDDIRIRTSVNQ